VKQEKYLVDELKEKPTERVVQAFQRSNIPLKVEVTIIDQLFSKETPTIGVQLNS